MADPWFFGFPVPWWMLFLGLTAAVVVAFLLALLTQIEVFPLFGLIVSIADNLVIGSIFTAVSIGGSRILRRLFEALHANAA